MVRVCFAFVQINLGEHKAIANLGAAGVSPALQCAAQRLCYFARAQICACPNIKLKAGINQPNICAHCAVTLAANPAVTNRWHWAVLRNSLRINARANQCSEASKAA